MGEREPDCISKCIGIFYFKNLFNFKFATSGETVLRIIYINFKPFVLEISTSNFLSKLSGLFPSLPF